MMFNMTFVNEMISEKNAGIKTGNKTGDLRDPQVYEIIRQNEELWGIYARMEEYSPADLDNHGRFTHASSSCKDISNPRLSQYLVDKGFRAQYPDNKKFAVCLTHDVDEIYPPISHGLLSSLYHMKNLNFNGLKNQLLWKRMGKEFSPYWNFKEIMAIEERFDAKSTFYFMAARRDVKRFRYDVEPLEHELGFIADMGWEVGLHGGYYAYDNLEEIKKEKRRLEMALGNDVIGYRNHYLRFKVPDTWELLAKAGFKYDATLGYEDAMGFRNGMCHPFRPFNLNTGSYIGILEIPLCIMDMTLWGQKSQAVGLWPAVESLIDVAEKYGGVLTLLWHNNMFNCPFRDPLCKLYSKILAEVQERNAWLTSAYEIWRWWNDY